MKKKVLLIAAIVAGVFTTSDLNAQEEGSAFKPASGDITLEVNFRPMNASPIDINNLRLRYFIKDDLALRASLHMDIGANTSNRYDSLNGSQVELETVNANASFGIGLGIEKHFAGTERLSPWVGADFMFVSNGTVSTDQRIGVDPNDATKQVQYESETTNGSTMIAFNVVGGVDYYFAKNFYLGTEVGLGFSTTANAEGETTNPGGPATTSKTPASGSFTFGENVNGAIRVGFMF